MSKGYSGLFHGTMGTSYVNGFSNGESYAERGIDIPEYIKEALSKLKKPGDTISGPIGSFSMKDVSIMSKETGVEFAHVTIGNKIYLIRGDEHGVIISDKLLGEIIKHGGTLDFHSHPYDNDCIPSKEDRLIISQLKRLTGQMESVIVTPNGRITTFNEQGVIETGGVSNIINQDMKDIYVKLFGGE